MKRDGDPRAEPFGPEVIAAFQAGDRAAFHRVFEALRQETFHVVRRFFRAAFDQEEALQEVWLQIYRMRSHLDVSRHAEVGAWARQVARNRCLDLLKARGRRPEVPVAELDPPHREVSMVTRLADVELKRGLALFLERLDEEERQFFELCFVEELPHEEIAGRMGINARRSKYLKQKILERLLKSSLLRKLVQG